jgi:hypothetical protein
MLEVEVQYRLVFDMTETVQKRLVVQIDAVAKTR